MNSPESQSKVRLIRISREYDGQRIDNFLIRLLKGVPKSRVYRILRKGEVRLNGGRVQPNYRVHFGDQIRLPPVRVTDERAEVSPLRFLQEQLEAAILLEDREVLVLNKPAGVAVHRGSGLEFGVIEILRASRPKLPFLELSHRLDRETSGCLVLAKTLPALRAIQAAQQSGLMDKRYLTLARGSWQYGALTVDVPLRRSGLRSAQRMVEASESGRQARSVFKPISLFRQASFLEVVITTGRTHQIRVHAQYLGHPIAGDEKYGDALFNREMARYGLRRLFLHAHSIAFPLANREISVSTPLDNNLKEVLGKFEETQ